MITGQEHLRTLSEKTARKAVIMAELAEVRRELDLARSLVRAEKNALAKEENDVEQLNKKNLPNLLYTVTGQMQAKRQTEITEAEQARIRYQTAEADADELAFREATLTTELRALGNCDKDMDTLVATMSERVLADGGARAAAIQEITERIERNTAEATALSDVANLGKRLILKLNEMILVLNNAIESMNASHPHHDGGRTPYAVVKMLEHSSVNSVLQSAEAQVPVLVEMAQAFRTDLVDIPSVGQLQMLQNTFRGTHSDPNRTQLEGTIRELEAVAKNVERSVAKLERIHPLRAEAAARAKEELIAMLLQ
jgi:hypothetical protein